MENVLLVVHVITCIALIGVVLLQRSEGGALGIGGGGGGGLMSGRGAASVLTRTTMILAAIFFVTSLTLTAYATRTQGGKSSLGAIAAEEDTMPMDLPEDVSGLPVIDDTAVTSELPTDIELPMDAAPETTEPAETTEDLPLDEPQN